MDENEIISKNDKRERMPVAQNGEGSSGESSESGGTPPEMPSDMCDISSGDCETPVMCEIDDENCEMQEPPEGFNGERPEMQGGMGPGGRGEFLGQVTASSDSVLHPVAYLAIGGGSVILGALISYACFSKFFHLKPGKTFDTMPKIIWCTVVAVLIAVGLITLGYFVPVWCR